MNNPSPPILVRQGSFEEALANGQRLLDRDPSSALRQAETLVRLKKDPRVFRLAAAACRKLDMRADAEGAELGAIEASLADPELKRAAEAAVDGRERDAQTMACDFLKKEPHDLLAMTLCAEASIALWELERAEALLDGVLERAPTFLRATMALSTCLSAQVRMKEAIGVLERFLARKPDNATALAALGQLSSEVGDTEQAVRIFERLVALDRDRPERWAHLAHHYRIVGRREDAVAAFRHALSIDSTTGSAWWSLANYFPRELVERDERAIVRAIRTRAGKSDEAALHLALGLIADRAGDYGKAFDHFVTGKKLRLAAQPYDPTPISSAVDAVIEGFTPDFYHRRAAAGWADSAPIFIIGMHRSGTTMAERILGRHSAIEGAGEMRIMPKLAQCVRHEADDPSHYADMLDKLPDKQLAWVGRRYIEASKDFRRTGKPRFVDKNNLNWMQIGLMLLALPDARVIDVRRNALDCCWANFKMLFSEGFPATNDLRHVGRFYRDYVRLFDAMQAAAPGRILALRYEDVVDDIEGQTRRMLDFLGLEFQPQCLDFHLATDAVATASSEQVRQPLNRKGIGSAEPYRPWLGPLIEELGPLVDQAAPPAKI